MLFVLLLSPMIFSCEEELTFEPDACFEFTNDDNNDLTFETGAPVLAEWCGDGEFLSFYPGDEGHVYGDPESTGIQIEFTLDNKDEIIISYAYDTPGNYEFVVIASSTTVSHEDKGLERSIFQENVTIVSGSDILDFTNFRIEVQPEPSALPETAVSGLLRNDSIILNVPFGSDVTELTPQFFKSNQATVSINGVEQVSNESEVDLSSPVTYTITGPDGSTREHVAVVNELPASDNPEFQLFFFPDFPAVVGEDLGGDSLRFILPPSADLDGIIPEWITAPFTWVTDQNGIRRIAGRPVDLSEPAKFVVNAQDGSQTVYTIIALQNATFTSFELTGAFSPNPMGRVVNDTLIINVLEGTRLDSVVPVFNTLPVNGVEVYLDGMEQESGTDVVDFTRNDLTYTLFNGPLERQIPVVIETL